MTTPHRPIGRPRRGSEVASSRLTIRLEPADRARLQAEADAAGEKAATTAQRGLLAWLAWRVTINARPALPGQEQ